MKEVNARYVGERKIKDKEKSVLEIAKELPPPGEITWKEKKEKRASNLCHNFSHRYPLQCSSDCKNL